MNPQEMRRMFERTEREIWQGQRAEVIDELYADDFTWRTPLPGYGTDRAGFKRFVRESYSAFEQLSLRTDQPIIEGDRLAYSWTARVRHVGEQFGFQPTNREAEYGGASIIRVRDGKVVEEWDYADTFTLMLQLGLIQQPELVGTRR